MWNEVIVWFENVERRLPTEFPNQLPPENDPDRWFHESRLEMQTRGIVSAKIRWLVAQPESPSMDALQAWFLRRRIEWACQVVVAQAKAGVVPDAPLNGLLEWLLVDKWESDGCIAMWNHAERGGQPHPENPAGLTPVP